MAHNFQQMHDPFASSGETFDPFNTMPQGQAKQDEISFFDQLANRDDEKPKAIVEEDFFSNFGNTDAASPPKASYSEFP